MVAIFGFKMEITPIAISLIGIFFPFMFFGRERFRYLAEAMIGFGILFIGLEFIKNSVPDIQDNPEMFMFLDSFTEYGFLRSEEHTSELQSRGHLVCRLLLEKKKKKKKNINSHQATKQHI